MSNTTRRILSRAEIGAVLLCLACTVQSAPAGHQDTGHPAFLSPHSTPIVVDGDRVFVVNTPADSVDVIDTTTFQVTGRIAVGIDPVSLALRPDGTELWVSNHVSDSVSVVDIRRQSLTALQVVATVQDIDPVTKATRFDEPVGIAFASNAKAYVALSSENRIAVINVATRAVNKRLTITAQDPRAIAVHGDRLFVLPFESGNRTQISGCVGPLTGELCTFDATEHVVTNNNVLSRFIDVDIVKHPQVPDRDLYIFDTGTDQLVQVVDTVGTLLYGLAVDSRGTVFVTQTDARNEVNGRAGTQGDRLAQLENRAFLNQLTRIDCTAGSCAAPANIDLEPHPPAHPAPGLALATPFAIAISADDALVVATAAGSDQLFTLDAASGQLLGRTTVDAVPRGIALVSGDAGEAQTAWVFNAAANTVSVVDLADATTPAVIQTIVLVDPTHPAVKRGRIAFNDANASTTGTFSCESCHPDGGTDQLLWLLDTPVCDVAGCNQVPPRITMPVRGLRDTAPYHWDGIPGDPFGGRNTANINANVAPNCERDDPASCTGNLVDGALASTMCESGQCGLNDEGLAGALNAAQRADMAQFLLAVPYPPAQRRAYTNVLSITARTGFSLFHIEGDLQGNPTPNVCGDCHRMPFWVSTNTPGTGMEAPTWRGAWDRWLILPQGRLNIIDFNFYQSIADQGAPERSVWRLSWAGRSRFDPVWNMVTEGSTGFSGAVGRQVTLSEATANAPLTATLLDALELSASEGGVVLHGSGVLLEDNGATRVALQFDLDRYIADSGVDYSRGQLLALAGSGAFVGTFTGRLGSHVDLDHPQPALWTLGPMEQQRGAQVFPTLSGSARTLRVSGRHVRGGAHVLVDGRRVAGQVRCSAGQLPDCTGEVVEIQLAALPEQAGTHFLQVQNRAGLMSNDFIFHTTSNGTGVAALAVSGPWYNATQDGHGWFIEQLAGAPGQPDRLNVYWYVFADGQPVWLIGQGQLRGGRAELDLLITSDGEFPPVFDPAAVNVTPWGRLSLEFVDDQTGTASWRTPLAGFADGSATIERLAAIASSPAGCRSGSYYNPDQSGHGFVAQVVAVAGQDEVLLAWYVYLAGRQVWLLGQAPLSGTQATVPMAAFSGAGFPPTFAADDVVSTPWGTVAIEFTGADSARVDWTPDTPGYLSGGLNLTRLTGLVGHDCP